MRFHNGIQLFHIRVSMVKYPSQITVVSHAKYRCNHWNTESVSSVACSELRIMR